MSGAAIPGSARVGAEFDAVDCLRLHGSGAVSPMRFANPPLGAAAVAPLVNTVFSTLLTDLQRSSVPRRVSAPGRRPRATMNEVAALAGLSLKTVSRVINGVPTVAPELRARVERAAAQLNYRPNLAASNLRRAGGRTATIGLLLEDIANPFSAAIHRGVEDVARARGAGVLAASLDEDGDRERELAISLVDRRVDGLIVVPAGTDHSYLIDEMRAGTALVFVDRPGSLIAADAVVTDNREGSADGVRHLLRAGHRRVAYLGDYTSISTARQRFEGYLLALREAGLSPVPRLIRHDLHTSDDAQKATMAMFERADAPTAVFASQNLVTIGAIRALHELGAQHEVALVGFDDFPLADMVEPAVTTIAQDPAAMGRIAAETLFRRIDGDASTVTTRVVPSRLVGRGSGEISPRTSGPAQNR